MKGLLGYSKALAQLKLPGIMNPDVMSILASLPDRGWIALGPQSILRESSQLNWKLCLFHAFLRFTQNHNILLKPTGQVPEHAVLARVDRACSFDRRLSSMPGITWPGQW